MEPQICCLEDPDSGASARVLTNFGFNCFAYQVVRGGRPIDVLWAEPGFESGTRRASGSGIPILFPFPGRIAGTSLSWNGRTYPLEAGDGRGNAIHGFVLDRPWRVTHSSQSRVEGQFQASRDDPSLLNRWPADFRITATYELAAGAMVARYVVENPGPEPLPCGLGAHPYFRVPIGQTAGPAAQAAGECLVKLPVSARWELEGMLPTGRLLPLDNPAECQHGLRFRDLHLDDVFTGLAFSGGTCRAAIVDPGSGLSMHLEFDRVFRECVVYNPPHRESICIEPYTCVPGSFGSTPGGLDTGLRILEPGASFTGTVKIWIE